VEIKATDPTPSLGHGERRALKLGIIRPRMSNDAVDISEEFFEGMIADSTFKAGDDGLNLNGEGG
jgi:hypothetical protein